MHPAAAQAQAAAAARGYPNAAYASGRPGPQHYAPPANPFAAAPMLLPQGMMTQDMLSLEQLSERGMSLAALNGQFGGYGGANGALDPSQGYLESALPEFRGYMNRGAPQPPPAHSHG
jgi:hypothetical protein